MATRKEIEEKIVEAVTKRLGKDSIFRAGKGDSRSEVAEVIPTGFPVFDHYILGCGGIPVGRIGELFSDEGVGKSALSLALLAAAQRAGGLGYLVEAEHGYSEERVRTYGVDPGFLLLSEPEHLEEALSDIEATLEATPSSAGPMLIVFDSLAAIPTKKEIEGGLIDPSLKVAEKARLMSLAMRVLSPLLMKHRAALLIVNQVRQKIGVLFGPNETTPGGRAVKFHTSWRVCLYPGKAAKDGKEHVGKAVTVQAVKNRFAPPFRKSRFHLNYFSGWDDQATLIEFAKDRKLLERGDRGQEAYDKGLAACQAACWRFGAVPDDGEEDNTL